MERRGAEFPGCGKTASEKRMKKPMISFCMSVMLAASMLLTGCKGDSKGIEQAVTDKLKTEEQEPEPTKAESAKTQEVKTEEDMEEKEKEAASYAAFYGTVEIKEDIIYADDFEDGNTEFIGRGSAKVTIVNDKAG